MESTWLAILGTVNIAGLVTIVTILLKLGRLWGQIENTSTVVATMAGKVSLLESDLGRYKVEVAKEYVSKPDLQTAVESIRESVNTLDRNLKDYIQALAQKQN